MTTGRKKETPLSEQAGPAKDLPRGALAVFFSIFLLAGLAAFFAMFVLPCYQWIQAKDWVETPMTVVTSEVVAHRGSDSTSYSVRIRYDYRFEERNYRGDRYGFFEMKSSRRTSVRAIAARYEPGSSSICYVNPKDPRKAVLTKEAGSGFRVGLIPLVFVLAGGAGVIYALRRPDSQGSQSVRRAGSPFHSGVSPAVASATEGRRSYPVFAGIPETSVLLRPVQSPLAKCLGILVFALFWNGIVAVFLWNLVTDWTGGARPWGFALFLVPFVLIGLFLVLAGFYHILALFNPRPHVHINSRVLPLGGEIRVSWKFFGRAARLHRFMIYLEGSEEVTYRHGKSDTTERTCFARIPLFDTTDRFSILEGKAAAHIPDDSMHTFEAGGYTLKWRLVFEGNITWWPDLDTSYEILITPPPPNAAAGTV